MAKTNKTNKPADASDVFPKSGLAGVMRISSWKRVIRHGNEVSAIITEKAKKGRVVVVAILGVEHESGDYIDPNQVLIDAGWTPPKE